MDGDPPTYREPTRWRVTFPPAIGDLRTAGQLDPTGDVELNMEMRGALPCCVCGDSIDLSEVHWQRVVVEHGVHVGWYAWHSRHGGPELPVGRPEDYEFEQGTGPDSFDCPETAPND